MNKKAFLRIAGGGLSIFLIFFIIILIISLSRDEPLDLRVSLTPCLGKNFCFVGEILELDIELKPTNSKYEGKEKDILIDSEAIEEKVTSKKAVIGNKSNFELPLKTSLKEGFYTININSDLEEFGDLLLKIKHVFWEIINKKYYASQKIEVRYPKVKVEEVNYDCKDNGFYIEELKLKLEEPTQNEMMCKIRIYTDSLVTTSHILLKKETTVSGEFHHYETEYTQINKLDLSGGIQNVNFRAGPAVQQTNTKIVSVCLINERDIELSPQVKKLKICKVNQKSFWEKIISN